MKEWQVQEAKQRFSELLDCAQRDGPQIVTRRGEPVAVVLDMHRYQDLSDDGEAFKRLLVSGPELADGDLPRRDHARRVDG